MTLPLAMRWLMSLAGACAVSLGVAHFAPSQTPAPPNQADETSMLRPQGDAAATPELVPPPRETSPENPASAPAANQQQGEAQVLEEGPVHEAFATPISASVEAGEIVSKEPPQPINETPPEYRPEGENVEWIPGYWMWLDDRSDFVWVSGVWRSIPPGRAWTPGHWAEADGGFVWVSGFWSDVSADEVAYLPYPPESLEEGPSTAAPSDNHFWIPGCWTWQNQQYSWRAGYWYPGQQNWMWTPDHYVYTPRGAVLVNGYWDYPVQRRGLLYAPVYWNNGYGYGNNYAYTPHRVVNTALLLSSLFINNNRGYYYYGNGYAGRNNFSPWYAGGRSAYYSPFYGFYSWQYGRDSNQWCNRFDYDRRGRDFGDRQRDGGRYGLVGTVDDLQRSIRMDGRRDGDGRNDRWDDSFRRLTDNERRDALDRSQKMQQFGDARREFEGRERNDYRAQLSQNDRGNRDGDRSREARANVPDNYRPSTFRLQTADGAADLRRQSRKRYRRHQQQVMRQDLDNRGANADQPNCATQPNRPDQANRDEQARNRSDVQRQLDRQRQSIENRQQQQEDRIRQMQQDQRRRTFETPDQPRRGSENADRGGPSNADRGDRGNRTPQPNFRSPNDSRRSGGEVQRGPSPNRSSGGEARGNSGSNRGSGNSARGNSGFNRGGGGGEARGGGGGNRGSDGNRGGGGGNRGGGNRGGGGGGGRGK